MSAKNIQRYPGEGKSLGSGDLDRVASHRAMILLYRTVLSKSINNNAQRKLVCITELQDVLGSACLIVLPAKVDRVFRPLGDIALAEMLDNYPPS